MCNARNHSPGCNCGWGGGWHQGGYGSSGFFRSFGRLSGSDYMSGSVPSHTNVNGRLNATNNSPASASPIYDARHPLRGSWVEPNASCPVCGCAVYFYKSPYGGSVYFDELGPPWPKHVCTDHVDLNSVVEGGARKPCLKMG